MTDRRDHFKRPKKDAEEERQKRLAYLASCYRHVFDRDEAGREVFKDLMEVCMTFKPTMTGNSWTYHNEGMRKVGLHILTMREMGIEKELKIMRDETYNTKEK